MACRHGASDSADVRLPLGRAAQVRHHQHRRTALIKSVRAPSATPPARRRSLVNRAVLERHVEVLPDEKTPLAIDTRSKVVDKRWQHGVQV